VIPSLPEDARARVNRLLDFALLLCGIFTLGLFILVLSWPLPDDLREEVGRCTRLLMTLFVLQEAVRFMVTPRRLELFRSRRLEALLALAAGLELVLGHLVLAWFHGLGTGLAPTTITLFYLAGTQLTLLAALGVRAIRDNRWLGGRGLSPSMVFILSFAGLICLGTLLLKTPHATTEVGLSWIDALFLSTSAVCVTGLSPVDISVVLTPHGQGVLLGLIQVGGLGVMTLTYFFAHFVAGGVSLRNRIGLQDLLSEENLGHIGAVLGIIVAFTVGIELLGATLIYHSFDGLPDAPPNLPFFALFHSVSAFCNAGFSTLSTNLADPRVAGHAGFLGVIMTLIVLGGLGFPVVKNVWEFLVAVLRRRLGLRVAAPPRLTANSRLVVLTTAVLIVGGAVLIWFTEFIAGGTRGVVAADSPWLTAFFHSVTARTAGFNITPVEALLPASAATLMFLMFVGGSPSSTAGGIKTSTLAVAALSLRRVVLGRSDIEAFGRRLPDDLANRALSVLIVAVAFITIVSVSLCALHPELSSADLVFEAVSAVGTVGLSRNLTPQLDSAAKGVLVFAMLVGRVGVLTFVMAFVAKREATGLRLPATTVTL
jgi:Trk-type K+ transport system membrane component